MRFTVLLTAVALAITHTAAAQEVPSSKSYTRFFGGQAGYSRHTLSGSDVDFHMDRSSYYGPALHPKNHPSQGLTVGVVARQQLYKVLWLQEELNYVRKGGQLTDAGFYDDAPIIINYVQLPLLLHLQVPETGQFALHVQAGAVANAALNERKMDSRYYAPGNTYTNNSLILAPAIGGGLSWQQERYNYFLNFRYSADPKDFFQRRYAGTDYTLRHKGILLTAGVLIGSAK